MSKARRWVFVAAGILLLAAVINVTAGASPGWYRGGVLQAAAIAATEITVLAGALEFIARAARSPNAPLYLLVFAVPPVLLPAAYVCVAAFFGRANAAPDTWHLLSLFALTNFVFSLLLAALLLLLTKVVIAIRS
jgi:hypothetical protein